MNRIIRAGDALSTRNLAGAPLSGHKKAMMQCELERAFDTFEGARWLTGEASP